MNMLEFHIEKDGDQFHTWCPQLKGCHSHGKSPQEAMIFLKDAMGLYLEDAMEESLISDQYKLFA